MGKRLKAGIFILAAIVVLFYIFQAYSGSKGLLPILFSAALIDSVNPCAFSILIITVAFLFSLGKLRSHILAVGTMYILGIFAIYMLIGLGTLRVLSLFNVPHFLSKIGACIMIAFGILEIINNYFPKFPIRLAIPKSAHDKIGRLIERASIPTALIIGIVVGMYEFPCTGGPYLMVLGLLHDSQTYLAGFAYLIFYNLIFVLPLVAILFIASDKVVLSRVESWNKESKNTRLFMGLIMIVLGLAIFIIQ